MSCKDGNVRPLTTILLILQVQRVGEQFATGEHFDLIHWANAKEVAEIQAFCVARPDFSPFDWKGLYLNNHGMAENVL